MKMRRMIGLIVLMGTSSCLLQAVKPGQGNNNAKEQMKTLPSGLKYKILTEADMDSRVAKVGDRVIVHYTGWLADENGEKSDKFDSSRDRKQPFSFALGKSQVIQGWEQGIQGMKIGEQRRLVIPSKLAYGAQGAGTIIPPHATLIFDVELLDLK